MPHQESVLLERRGHVAWLTLCRPQAANALSRQVVAELGSHLSEIARDSEIWAVVITGAGEKVFCAGADLKERKEMGEQEVVETVQGLRALMGQISALPQPVIAAMNGGAFGGGLELALACDLRLLVDGARVGLPETSLGIIPGAGGSARLARIVGLAKAKEMILMAQKLEASQALAIGLVHGVSASAEFQAFVDSWLEALLSNAPLALQAAKAALDGGFGIPLAEALEQEERCYATTIPTKDRLEALAAFAEKRKPKFRGC